MKHLIETIDSSSLPIVEYDRIILNSATNDVIVKGGGYEYEVIADSYIYNEVDNKYYQKLVAYGKPIETNAIVDLNSQWIFESEDNEYRYFKSDSCDVDFPVSQCKVTWSNLTSITFKYMTNSDMGNLFVSKLDSEKFTGQSSDDDIYLTTGDKTPGTYNEFTIECDEDEHHIWFGYGKMEGATDEDRGFIGVPKSAVLVLDVKQGAELPMEYKYGGVSAEGGKTYDINFNNVTLPNGSIVVDYKNVEKIEKAITYEYVDLGLESSTLWATCNIGASSKTEKGVFFQWGETSGISETLLGKYSNENYSWATSPFNGGASDYDEEYFTTHKSEWLDDNGNLKPEFDAAAQIMGGDWRMPTETECQELMYNTTRKWTQVNGVNGFKFTGSNGNSIFIPAAGRCDDGSVEFVGGRGDVWSSSLDVSYPYTAYHLYFVSSSYGVGEYYRYLGMSVRGVRK